MTKNSWPHINDSNSSTTDIGRCQAESLPVRHRLQLQITGIKKSAANTAANKKWVKPLNHLSLFANHDWRSIFYAISRSRTVQKKNSLAVTSYNNKTCHTAIEVILINRCRSSTARYSAHRYTAIQRSCKRVSGSKVTGFADLNQFEFKSRFKSIFVKKIKRSSSSSSGIFIRRPKTIVTYFRVFQFILCCKAAL